MASMPRRTLAAECRARASTIAKVASSAGFELQELRLETAGRQLGDTFQMWSASSFKGTISRLKVGTG